MSETVHSVEINGHCAKEFDAVRKSFAENFREHGEIGARVTVFRGDEKVVDIWAGHTDEEKKHPWTDRTLVNTMSISKGVVAIAAHLLADRGLLDYDAPVAMYWPEFAQGGKQSISIRQLMSHQASLVFIDEAEVGDVLRFDDFSEKIARQVPNWPPGTDQTYHSITYGFLVGTLIERIDGRSVKRFVQEELTGPLTADFIFGIGEEDLPRVARTIFNPKNEMMSGGLINEVTVKCFAALPADPEFFNSTPHWKAVIPSSSGLSHAEAIARIFAPLANNGRFEGKSYFKPSTIKAMSETQWHANDSLFENEFSVTLGLLNSIDFNYFGRAENFGSAGAGGFTGFADPVNHISFGYTPVRMTSGEGLGDEPRRLVNALYTCV